MPPTLSQRVLNRLDLKRRLLKEWIQEDIPEMEENGIKLRFRKL